MFSSHRRPASNLPASAPHAHPSKRPSSFWRRHARQLFIGGLLLALPSAALWPGCSNPSQSPSPANPANAPDTLPRALSDTSYRLFKTFSLEGYRSYETDSIQIGLNWLTPDSLPIVTVYNEATSYFLYWDTLPPNPQAKDTAHRFLFQGLHYKWMLVSDKDSVLPGAYYDSMGIFNNVSTTLQLFEKPR